MIWQHGLFIWSWSLCPVHAAVQLNLNESRWDWPHSHATAHQFSTSSRRPSFPLHSLYSVLYNKSSSTLQNMCMRRSRLSRSTPVKIYIRDACAGAWCYTLDTRGMCLTVSDQLIRLWEGNLQRFERWFVSEKLFIVIMQRTGMFMQDIAEISRAHSC